MGKSASKTADVALGCTAGTVSAPVDMVGLAAGTYKVCFNAGGLSSGASWADTGLTVAVADAAASEVVCVANSKKFCLAAASAQASTCQTDCSGCTGYTTAGN